MISPLVTDNSGEFSKFDNKYSWSEYRDFIQSSSTSQQEDVWKIARINNKFLEKHVPKSEVLFTIYPRDPSWLVSIDSGQLYGYSCFECTDNRGFQINRTFPPFSEIQAKTLGLRNYIQIFSTSPELNLRTSASIKSLDSRWKTYKNLEITFDSTSFYAILLKK
jgi:hypothetical protein